MKNPFEPDPELKKLETLIERVTDDMEMYGPDSDEYSRLITYLERLNEQKAAHKPKRVSRDQVVQVVGNLAGILLIIAYEQKHVMTSKALPLAIRTKLKD